MSADLLARARAGEGEAFADLVAPYRRELHVHCYRILGSVADADEALQETLVSAWRSVGGFEGRSSLRTWLYRIATSRCLNLLRASKRREGSPVTLPEDARPPAPTRLGEVTWLEPYPDVLLEEIPAVDPDPAARAEVKEQISLAFVTALQLLPPRQRAALILRDVLDFSAREVAAMLETTEESVTSALKRARSTLSRQDDGGARSSGSAAEQQLLERLVAAFEAADVAGIVALMTEDAWLRMPPLPLEYQGRDLIGEFFAVVAFRKGRRYRLIPTRANGQPAFGTYLRDPYGGPARLFGLLVVTVEDGRVSALTRFETATAMPFGMPRLLPD